MNKKNRTGFKDLLVSLLLGVCFSSLLGFLSGLRVLNWNPELIADFRNIIFLLLSSTYLYAFFGLAVGAGIWVIIWLISRIFGQEYRGRSFIGPWVCVFLISSAVLFVYLAATRQNLRSANFDNVLLVGYYLSALLFGLLLRRSVKPRTHALSGKDRLLTLPKFWGIFLLYLIIVVGTTLVTSSGLSEEGQYGDPEEIQAALAVDDIGTRVAIIGWDGGEWTVINELLNQGDLPNLQRLIDDGVSAPFRSLPEMKSPLIWTSIATGKVPEKHGIEDFGSFQFPGMVNNFTEYPDGMGYYRLIRRLMRSADLPVSSSTRRVEAFWNILSRANRSVGVVGWWASWPAEKVNGFVVSDRFTYTLFNPVTSAHSLRTGQTYPPELLDEVEQFCRLPDTITEQEYVRFMPNSGGRKNYPAEWSGHQYTDWNPMYQFEIAYTASESFRKAGAYLYQKYRPSAFAIYFEGVDMVSHFFWQYYRPHEFISVPPEDVANFGNVVPEFYRYMDEILGEYLEMFEPGTDVIILSDHGFGFDLNPVVPFRTGEHRLHGILVASGPHFQKGVELDEVSVLDVTPTLLYLFGLPSARDMDGRIVTEALDPEFVAEHPPQYIQSYETERRISSITRSSADEQVREQIRALGYVN